LDLARLHQALQSLVEPADDLVLAPPHLLGIDAVEAEADACGCRLGRRIGELADVTRRLGRAAAAVQAGATELVLLRERELLAELGSAQRGRVAAAATAQDHDVELVSACLRHLCAPRCLRVLATRSDPDGRRRRLRAPC